MRSDPTHSAGILKRLHGLFQSIFAAPQSEDPAGFLYWRERIHSGRYLAGTVFGLVVIYPTLSFLIPQRYFLLVAIDILAFLWGIAALLMHGSMGRDLTGKPDWLADNLPEFYAHEHLDGHFLWPAFAGPGSFSPGRTEGQSRFITPKKGAHQNESADHG